MKPTKLLSALVVILLMFASCQKDDGSSGNNSNQEQIPDTFSEYFGNQISRDFLGTVIDKNHNPIDGVTITIGNETAMTDSNGVFILNDATVNQRFGFIKAEKVGYIHGSRSVVPSNGTNKVTIMLLEETIVGSVSSGSAETVTANDGSSVSFDGNFVKEDGSAYTGSVDVIMHHLDPADEDMAMQMPGMLYAENEDGAERMLQTLGMLAVELRGSGGEDLNLPEGSTSEIRIPVDPSLMGIAPATIPLWYFDEANGYWKEEGVATLQGNMYVGTVAHFSFWNCDIPAEVLTLCVTVTDEEGNELSNMDVTITSTTYGTRNGYTNEKGEVCGLVPSDENLVLKIYNYGSCGIVPIVTENIGPFTSDYILTVIVPDSFNIVQETITGNFMSCSGEPVSNGYVLLNYGGNEFTGQVSNGAFEITFYRCSNSPDFTLTAIDYENSQSSIDLSYNFSSPLTDIGDIISCDEYEYNYIYFQLGDNEPTSLIEGQGPLLTPSNFECEMSPFVNNNLNGGLIYESNDQNEFSSLQFKIFNFYGPGTYIGDGFAGLNSDVRLNSSGAGYLNHGDGSYIPYSSEFIGIAEVLTFGEIGEVVEIIFSGTIELRGAFGGGDVLSLIAEDVPIQGYMHLIREN